MATQSIEVKDFSGGRNFITSPFNLYPTEATVFTNISLDTTGMRTRNFVPDVQLLPPSTNPIRVAPKLGQSYDLTSATSSYLEKVRFYQGNNYIIKGGVTHLLGADGETFSTTVINTMDASAPQEQYIIPVEPAEINVNYKIEQYTYFISYRSAAGFESPLEKMAEVNAMISWNDEFTEESASTQTIIVTSPPAEGDYGRIYRMGGNISYPSLVFQFDHNWVVSQTYGIVTTNAGTFTFEYLDHELGQHATTWGAIYPGELKYLTSTKYGLAAAKGSQVYLSMSKPDGWSELNSLNLGSPITGLASVYRGFLIFTEGAYAYLVTGSSLSKLQVNLISTDIGCTSNSTIAEVGQHALIWIYGRRFYMFNGTQIKEVEANTYDFLFFEANGYDKDLTGISMYNKYLIGTDTCLTMIDMNHKYVPFLDYDLQPEFKGVDSPGYLRETIVDQQKFPGIYKEDGSFWSLRVDTYEDVDYADYTPPSEGWAMGCYSTTSDGSIPVCEEDLTTCLEWGCYGGYSYCDNLVTEDCLGWYEDGCIVITAGVSACILPSGGCDEGAVIGLYPNWYEGAPDLPGVVPVRHKSEYRSPMFTFGDINAQCTFSSVEVLYKGELSIFAYIDEKEIVFRDNYISSLKAATARLLLPNAEARGNFLQVRLRFNGVIYGYRVNGEPLRQRST